MTKEIEILIAKYFDNNISIEEMNMLNAWANQSDEHGERIKQLLRLRQITHPSFNPDDINLKAAEDAVLQRIGKSKNTTYKNIPAWWQKIAAVLLIPVLFFSGYLWINNRKINASQAAIHEVTALPGTRTKVNLPDGSEVWLNSGSTLSYPLAFKHNERKITLRGEGYFIVDADRKRPFYITTNELQVMITGTELNVESYPNDTITSVILASGSATVITDNHTPVLLKPNQHFSLNTRSRKYDLHPTDAALYGKWKEGVLAFRDETLESVFKRIGRTFNVEIQIKDSALARHQYRATFEKESLQQILDLISLSAPIQYKHVKTTNNGITKEVIEVHPK